jgi:RNase P/RNase MRP subunit p30
MEYIIINEKTFEKSRKKIKENSNKKIIFYGEDDQLNRKILEKEKIDILLLRLSQKKDRMKQKESGFDHVMSEIAKKKGVSIGIDLDEIINSKEKKEILSRIKQNIKLASKKKLKMIFISKNNSRTKEETRSLGLILGMPTWMTKNNYLNLF